MDMPSYLQGFIRPPLVTGGPFPPSGNPPSFPGPSMPRSGNPRPLPLARGIGQPYNGSYAEPDSNHSTLPANLLGRYGTTERFNCFDVPGNTVANAALDWIEVTVDRPTILRPLQQLDGLLHYCPHAIPIRAPFGGSDPRDSALLAVGPGLCYLWTPGKWFVHYTNAAGLTATLMRVTVEDSVQAASLLSEPGFQLRNYYRLTTNAVPNTSESLAAANRFRRGMIITSGSATAEFSIGLGGNANIGAGTKASVIISGIGAAYTLAGPHVYRGSIQVACSQASQEITATEWS